MTTRRAPGAAAIACSEARRQMHAWLDTIGAPMPAPVAEHLRACCDCLTFLATWNRVELAMRDLNAAVAVPSAPTAAAILARSTKPRTVPWYVLTPRASRLAAAGLAVALALIALWWAAPLSSRPSRGLDAMAVGARAGSQSAQPGPAEAPPAQPIR